MNECELEGIAGNCGIDCRAKLGANCSYLENIHSQKWKWVVTGIGFKCFGCEIEIKKGNFYWGQDDGLEFCDDCYYEWVRNKPVNQKKEPPAEITYSFDAEFKNKTQLSIPGPTGDNWKSETTYYDWPHVFLNDRKTDEKVRIEHMNGQLIFREYKKRIEIENARLVSITKWTKVPCVTDEKGETFEERAIRRYPSVWR